MFRWLCCGVFLVALWTGLFGCPSASPPVDGGESTPEQSGTPSERPSSSLEQPDSTAPVVQEKLEKHEFQLVDKSRTTPESDGNPELPQRNIRLLVWVGPMQAAQAGTFPLLVMAHGLNGLPDRFEAIARYFASQGIVVAAPEFPLTHYDPNGKVARGIADLRNQPGDVTFALNWLVQAVADASSPLYKRFHPTALGLLGHSYGGATALGLTRYDCCLEKRFKAVVLVSASTQVNALAFGAPAPSPQGPPTLLIHGRKDETIVYASSLTLYDGFLAPRFFLGLAEAEHSNLLESQEEPPISARASTQKAVIAFLREFVDEHPQAGNTASVLRELEKEGREIKIEEK